MRIFFNGDREEISNKIKEIIGDVTLIPGDGFIEVRGFKKGYIYDHIPRLGAIKGVLKVETSLDEVAPLSATKNFHFKKPFNSGKKFIIAGPCVIDRFDVFERTLLQLNSLGINIIRTPLFKPRSSPYAWEGLGLDGIEKLLSLKKRYRFISVMEILDYRLIDRVYDVCDVIQIGARNMRNYVLLKEVASTGKVILLKRHPYATLRDFILSAEYLAKYGAEKIILCERGDSFSDGSPSINLDIIDEIKRSFKIPIIADISHSGKSVEKSFEFALKTFKDVHGLMVEVVDSKHISPIDTRQVMSMDKFRRLLSLL